MSNTQKSPIVSMALIGSLVIGLFYAGQGLEKVGQFVSTLPVQGKQPVAEAAAPKAPLPEKAQLYPLMIESTKKAANLGVTPSEGADASASNGMSQAFVHDAAPVVESASVPVVPPPLPPEVSALPSGAGGVSGSASLTIPMVDGFKQTVASLRVSAITPTGAIINDRYVEIGDSLMHLQYTDDKGKARTLMLASVTPRNVVVQERGGPRKHLIKIDF